MPKNGSPLNKSPGEKKLPGGTVTAPFSCTAPLPLVMAPAPLWVMLLGKGGFGWGKSQVQIMVTFQIMWDSKCVFREIGCS